MKKICKRGLFPIVRVVKAMLCVCGVFALAGCDKARLDDEVRRLCAIDGGMKIYEKVKLPASRFGSNGKIKIPSKNSALPSDDFYYETDTTYLRTGDPDLLRSHDKIIRRRDGKILGELVYYVRRGGDIPGPWHPSSFDCPTIGSLPNFESSIFVVGEE